jgi:murein L,D-transpeptidase YafK
MATSSSFKTHQLTFTRVEEAYAKYGSHVQSYLSSCEIDPKSFNLYLRCFKHEKLLELWAKSNSDDTYKLLKTYELYGFSGTLGPKRAQGDYQIPEGFYHIDRFNPMSKFHLSLGINYPNASDKVLSHKQKPGGDIFIHGGCQTIGCMPISDEWIEELYVYCVEARNSGQNSIPVNIFPFKMEFKNTMTMKGAHPELASDFVFWDNVQPGYQFFEETRTLPKIQFNTDGSHTLK